MRFAKEQYTPAWQIFGGSKLLWWFRWKVLHEEMDKIEKK